IDFTVAAISGDPSDASVTYGAFGLPPGQPNDPIVIDSHTGRIHGTLGWNAAEYMASGRPVQITATNSHARSTATSFTWTVINKNSAPSITMSPAAVQVHAGAAVSLRPSASDPDQDPLTFGASGLPAGVTIDSATGAIAGRSTAVGVYPVTVTADDRRSG